REAMKVLRRGEKHRGRKAEVVWLLFIDQSVERLVTLLARDKRAVAVRRRARGVDRLIRFGRAVRAEVVAGRPTSRVRDGAGVPDAVRVGLHRKTPADDPPREILGAGREDLDHLIELHEAWVHLDADLLVLVDRGLEHRLAHLVAGVGDDRELE